jgi:hypothetical protein
MKRIITLACAVVLVLAMNVTAFAANSPAAGNTASSNTTTADPGLATGTQQFNENTIAEFAEKATILSENATAAVVSTDVAKEAIAQAKAVVGADVFVASIFDLQVPAGTGKATFKVACPHVWAGQSVKILHKLANGTWETITPDKVENNAVTFTMSSYSPIAIVVDVTPAPKTGDMAMVVAAMAVICLAGAYVASRKVQLS